MGTNPLPFHPQADIIDQILKEVKRAKQKHPNWPDHIVARSAIVAEEAGELVKACLEWKYERSEIAFIEYDQYEAMKREAVQTAAMAIRFLENLDSFHSLKTIQANDTRNRKQAEDPISENTEG